MKWDYASVTIWGLDQVGPEGEFLFDKFVCQLTEKLGGDIEIGELLNGYQVAVKIVRGGELLAHCLTGGTGSAVGSSQFIAASTANEVYPLIRELHPHHSVSRLDAAEDYCGVGTWEKLEAMLTKVCGDHKISMAPFGEGHRRPDGTRDETKGRSWYFGSKKSQFRVVLYEKGLEQLAKGVPADPTWVRLETRIMPKSRAKSLLGMMDMQPIDILGFSRWGLDVAAFMGAEDIKRIAIGSVWKPNDIEQVALKIVRMFDKGIEHLLEREGSAEAVGRLLIEVQQKVRESKGVIQELAINGVQK